MLFFPKRGLRVVFKTLTYGCLSMLKSNSGKTELLTLNAAQDSQVQCHFNVQICYLRHLRISSKKEHFLPSVNLFNILCTLFSPLLSTL